MSAFHDSELPKPRKIVGYILSVLVSAMLIFSGVMKLLKDDFMVQNMSAL